MKKTIVLLALLLAGCSSSDNNVTLPISPVPAITDFSINYPNKSSIDPSLQGSTHEITFNSPGDTRLWVTGENYDQVVEVGLDGSQTFHPMPADSGPHGIVFDAQGQLFVCFEHLGQVARLDTASGVIESSQDVHCDPHGLGVGPDGSTLWFTGKTQNTVGQLSPSGQVTNYQIPTANALAIYIKAGPDGNMWFTELTGNKIGRVTPTGDITEFAIPTANSRPIAIVPEPGGQALWFSEEAGNNIGRIDLNGNITEYPVPKSQSNVILAGLAFDSGNNLWVQQYVDANNPTPTGDDHIYKFDKSILQSTPKSAGAFLSASYVVPTRGSVMHRIVQGPDGNMWFTELKSDKVGRIQL